MSIKCPLIVLVMTCVYGCVGHQGSSPENDQLSATPKICDRTACYLEPSYCVPEENCEYALSVKETGDKKSFKFNLRGRADGFVAIGLSKDKILGNDDMVACVLNGSTVEVKHIYGEYSKLHISDLDAGATVSKASYDSEHGIIHCVFTRKKILKSVPQYFNMKRKWYLIFASGSIKKGMPLLRGGPQKVTKRKVALAKPVIYSESQIKLVGKPKIAVDSKEQTKGNQEKDVHQNHTTGDGHGPPKLLNLNKCGKYHQCIKVPDNCEWNNCQYSVRIKENGAGDSLTFHLTGKSTGWIALAFSNDKLMNEDDAVFCISSKTKDNADVKHAYTGRHYIEELNNAEDMNVHSVSAVDGYISCKFTRRKIVPDNDKMFNLYQPHFIFLASGPVTSSIHRPMQHSTTPLISEHMVNFTSTRGLITLDKKPTQESPHDHSDHEDTKHDGREHHPHGQTGGGMPTEINEPSTSPEFLGPPGLQLLPNKPVISYRPSAPASYMKFVRVLTTFIPNSNTHPTCNPDTMFGYASGDPCFIVKFTENSEKWAPLPYPPIPLPHTIKNIYDDTHLPLTCEGKTNADKRAIGSMVITPSAGFLSADLQNSFVTVQLMNPTENVSIRIICFIWAANIDHSRSEGRIDFLVKVKGPA